MINPQLYTFLKDIVERLENQKPTCEKTENNGCSFEKPEPFDAQAVVEPLERNILALRIEFLHEFLLDLAHSDLEEIDIADVIQIYEYVFRELIDVNMDS